MPMESVICRRRLDEERGNPWICVCPCCAEKRKEVGEGESRAGEEEREGRENSPHDLGTSD